MSFEYYSLFRLRQEFADQLGALNAYDLYLYALGGGLAFIFHAGAPKLTVDFDDPRIGEIIDFFLYHSDPPRVGFHAGVNLFSVLV